jgi:endosialidase-like protein
MAWRRSSEAVNAFALSTFSTEKSSNTSFGLSALWKRCSSFKTSEAILALKPVTFRYKREIDPNGTLRFGLVAEEVEKIDPDLVGRDAKGQVSTVRYEAVNAMLLNEFLKEHRKVQKLEAVLRTINKRLKEQDAKIDKVNAKVELTKPAPQTVLNNQ